MLTAIDNEHNDVISVFIPSEIKNNIIFYNSLKEKTK